MLVSRNISSFAIYLFEKYVCINSKLLHPYLVDYHHKSLSALELTHTNAHSCSDATTYDCQYDGLVSMGPCFFGSPLYFAKANFKDVDARIKGLVDEESFRFPLPDKQSFYIDMVSAREQLSSSRFSDGFDEPTNSRYLDVVLHAF